MSDLSRSIHNAHVRLTRWLAKRHPEDTEIQAIADEAEKLAHGGEAIIPDVPVLVKDGVTLSADVGRLAVDFVAKTVNVADLLTAGKDAWQALRDVEKALADFKAAYAK